MRIMLRVLITLATIPVLIVCVMYGWAWYRLSQPCVTIVNAGGAQFWEWSKTQRAVKVSEQATQVRGRLADDPGTCFVVEKSRRDDPAEREQGYTRALAYHMMRWGSGRGTLGSSAGIIRELTGQEFKNAEAAQIWWYQNRDRLSYSPQQDRLVVDPTDRGSIYSSALSADQVIRPAGYWYLDGLRKVTWLRDEDAYRVVQVPKNASYRLQEPELVEVRVELQKLSDPEEKRQGYQRALDQLLRSFYPEGDAANDEVVGNLQTLTGLGFREVAEWQQWQRDHRRSKWVLSTDGDHLVPVEN